MLVKLLKQLNSFLLHYAFSDLIPSPELMQRQYGAIAPEFVIDTPEDNSLQTDKVESVSTHYAGLHCHVEGAVLE